jgi:Kdo2-lipid IVA lauroyltransferase/acyltransferase
VVGWDDFSAAASEGRGIVLATGHFGNWEVGGAAIAARHFAMSVIVKRQSNPLVDRWIDETRARLGMETISQDDAPRRVPRALRAGHAVGIVADQDAWGSGVWVPFFGIPSSTHRGPALFALRMNAPIFAVSAFRIPGDLRYRVVLERVRPQRSGVLSDDVIQVTAELTRMLEAAVIAAPGQYFWFHKRWKTPIPAELIDSPTGTSSPDGETVQLKETL